MTQDGQTPAYGAPASPEVIQAQGFEDGVGLIFEVRILDNSFQETIKPRRRTPEVTEADFFSSLVNIDGRFFFSGILNEWPALTTLELIQLKIGKKQLWNTNKGSAPAFPKGQNFVLAMLRAPDYTNYGYERDNPGFFWWADASKDGKVEKFYYGQDVIRAAGDVENKDAVAARVHMFGHRYAKKKETLKDKISYHSGVIIEWDHHQYCTILELAWLNGISGYRGNSNWVIDSHGSSTEENSLYKLMPDSMRAPWHENRSELRMIDVPWKSIEDCLAYFKQFTGKRGRFIDPKIRKSHDVLLQGATREKIAEAMYNFIRRDPSYSEPKIAFPQIKAGNNCQTFAADVHGYLRNKKTAPFTRAASPVFTARPHLFEKSVPQM